MRRVISMGLIAGLTLSETLAAAPGLVFDLYFLRRQYDDQMHGVRRKRKEAAYD